LNTALLSIFAEMRSKSFFWCMLLMVSLSLGLSATQVHAQSGQSAQKSADAASKKKDKPAAVNKVKPQNPRLKTSKKPRAQHPQTARAKSQGASGP
jgi:hypothetical protein